MFCGFSCNWISDTTVQIRRKSVCRQIRNSAPFLSLPQTLVDVLDVLSLCARWSQAMSVQLANSGNFLFPAGPAHSTRAPAHLIKETCASATHFTVWVGYTHYKILQTMLKTRPNQERFENTCVGDNFCPTTQFWGVGGPKAGHFFSECLWVCPEWIALLLSALGWLEIP